MNKGLCLLLATSCVAGLHFAVSDQSDAEDMLTCLNLFEYHSQHLQTLSQLSGLQLRAFLLSYVNLCREHLSYPGDYTKYVAYVGGVATPLFPQEQYLSLKLT